MAANRANSREGLDQNPFWYKSGVIYEVHVRAFCDSTGDGTGDFRGLTQKLDYIKDLGVTAVWLLPFYPSPLRDDGYDIADYCDVHPMYGALADFKIFLREAHRRGLRVITELVLNHTSDQHPWFQRARRAKPGSRWREFYVWSDTPDKYKDARIIFKDVEISNWTWDHEAKAYFWHRFFSHQPDLNWDNPEVHEQMLKVLDFWLDMGVDGLRLDAVPYLYEREGTSCENLPETHACLKELRKHVDEKYRDRMLLSEANQWPEDAVAYFGQGRGDESHVAFHFPLMPRLFMSLRMEDRTPIVEIMEQTPPIPETAQWALFLRNHDELTLEMVTDEERDYMYRMYAHVHLARLNLGIRRRLAPLLGNDRKRIELLNALLFSMPGTPVLYYGDEIGLGDNIFLGDRNGVRTPMQWSSDKNAGFSRANPQSLYLPIILDPGYHYEACNVEAQLANPHSLLWWMRRMLALRKRWRALGEGKCTFLQPENRKILSYVLRFEDEKILVVANLSRFVQAVELDLAEFKQCVPVELFGRAEFPPITERPYFLSLGPHSFFWFALEPRLVPALSPGDSEKTCAIPKLAVDGEWQNILTEKNKTALETVLPNYLQRQRWFIGANGPIKSVAIQETIPIALADRSEAVLAFLHVEYVHGDPDDYQLPLAHATGSEAARLLRDAPTRVVAELNPAKDKDSGVLYDAIANNRFGEALLVNLRRGRRLKGAHGNVEAIRAPTLRRLVGKTARPKKSGEFTRRNSSVVCGNKIILKLFRRLEPGINPDFSIGQFLTAKNFPYCRPLAGALEYANANGAPITLAVANTYIPAAKSAWEFTLDALSRYYDRVVTWVAEGQTAPGDFSEPPKLLDQNTPADVAERIGTFLESARVIGLRTAELHLVLASDGDNPEFAPEPFTPHYQRALHQSMRVRLTQNLKLLRRQLKSLPPEILSLAQEVIALEPNVDRLYQDCFNRRLAAKRVRIHGDFHLDQILWTGKDFVFFDFEGDPHVPISERCIKRSPLRDVAAVLRSFHYAADAALRQLVERGIISSENLPRFEPWARYWNRAVSLGFLKAYLQRLAGSGLLPENEDELRTLLRAFLLHQMAAEVGHALASDAKDVKIPLRGILYLAGKTSDAVQK